MIKLVCRDGETVVPKLYSGQLKLFKRNPELADAPDYVLRCNAKLGALNLLLGRLYDKNTPVQITEENFSELRGLCYELGFSGINEELDAFDFNNRQQLNHEVITLRARVARQEKLLMELQGQIRELLEDKKKANTASYSASALDKRPAAPRSEHRPEDSEKLDKTSGETLSHGVDVLKEHERRPEIRREFVFTGSNPLDGVIAQLSRDCGGNVHDKEIVEVTGNGMGMTGYEPKCAADLSSNSRYYSSETLGSWICYDLKERSICPHSYTVKSYGTGPGGCHPKSWVFEGSHDKKTWTALDRRGDNNDLNDSRVTRNFTVQYPSREFFRFLRLRLTGENHNGGASLRITALEVFGVLVEK